MKNLTYPTYFSYIGKLPTSEYIRDGATDTDAGDEPQANANKRTAILEGGPKATYAAAGHTHAEAAQPPQTAEQTLKKLNRAVDKADQVLASASTVFPFTLFPDTVTIDREKVTITSRSFFRVAEVLSLRIEDVLSVAADVGPFFGSLKLTSRYFESSDKKPHVINYLWREDAQRMKRVLQGYLIARTNNIDCSKLSTKQLSESLDKLGQTPNAES